MKAIQFLVFSLLLILFFQVQAETNPCQSDRVSLQMLGTGGPELITYPALTTKSVTNKNKASTSYLIWLDNKARIIIDAGPGSANNFKQTSARYEDLSVFLFTHFHVDHSNDFAALIKGGFFSERNTDLLVFGPSGDTFILSANQFVERSFSASNGLYPYLSSFIDRESHSAYQIKTQTIEWTYKNVNIRPVYKNNDFNIQTVSVHHGPFPALAYRIEVAGCVLSFTGDMSGRLHSMPDLAKHSDILVAHNAIPEDAVGRAQLLHMKPSYIGKIAGKAEVKKLLLTHLMERSMDRRDETIQEIRKHYQGPIIFPQDLDHFQP